MESTISREELKAKLDRGDDFALVEALPEAYYRRSHLPGALHMPADRVRELAPVLLPDKDRQVITYCMSSL
jgi:rhodanese-related sulfurtransferase